MSVTVTQPAGRKVLYFCPSTMQGNVIREIKRWSPHRSVVALGGRTKAQRSFLLDTMRDHPEYVVVLNYEAWRKDLNLVDDLIDIEFDTCIIDEAHNIKDRKSSAYKGVHRILTGGIDGQAAIPFVLPMTGTPLLNKPQEFYSLLTLVDPQHFRNDPTGERYFLMDYCQQDYSTGKWGFKPGGTDRLFKKFPSLFLRRTKEQAGIKLPPKTVIVHDLVVDETKYPKQAEARNQMREWGSIMLDPERGTAVTAAAQIAVYTRLRQVETWPASIKQDIKDMDPQSVSYGEVIKTIELGDEFAESQKLDEIIHWENGNVNDWDGLLPEIVYNPVTGDGERVVIFSQFKYPLRIVAERCERASIRAAVLDGETPESVRQEIAMDFDIKTMPDNANCKYDVVLCNYKVGGVGLNFTCATQMIVLDEEWNPGKRDQAYDRIHRMGQEKPVTIHVLRSASTIDDWLANLIDEKEALVDGFNRSSDNIASAAFEALKSGLM